MDRPRRVSAFWLPLVLPLVAALAAGAAQPPSPLEPPPPPPPAITDVTHRRCSDFICSLELCLPIEDCDGEVVPDATECGCCPLCIKYLEEGRACGRHGVLRFPEKPTTMCRPPLRCVAGYCAAASAHVDDGDGDGDEASQRPFPRRGARPALPSLDDNRLHES